MTFPDENAQNQELPAFLTAEEATEYLNISVAAFQALAGWYLKSTRVGNRYMYRTADLQALLDDMEIDKARIKKP